MLQTNLKVVAVGEPDLETLTDGEKRTFFESIFSRITRNNAGELAIFSIQCIIKIENY